MCIFERYEQALANNITGDFKYSVMQDVLDAPAPSFFLNPDAAVKFYYHALARR